MLKNIDFTGACGKLYQHEKNEEKKMARVERALISVSDKTGIVEFARELQHLGVEIISTGGTSKLLKRMVSASLKFPNTRGSLKLWMAV